ncbi:MAG TPA: sugar ABC transporter permease [Caldilineaceae bacterium]|nr:sugar ABC transporter permease [Caldilineaceae bacterium]HRW10333.1 sugar ABC transporter permease [Caldilineaceae bacterium]
MLTATNRQRLFPYLLILPSIVLLFALIIYPTIFVISNSFYFWNLQTSPVPQQFIGWQNYAMVFRITPFVAALRNTVLIAVIGTFVQFWLGMGIALLLTQQLRGMNVVRALLIMPVTIAPVVTGFLFRYMYYREGGLLTWLLLAVGIPVPDRGLLGVEGLSLASVLLADIWQWTPFFAVILYAGLLSISNEIVEAARVDGARGVTLFRLILFPLVWRTAVIVILIRFMQLFNMFDLVLVLTRGGPGTSSRTLAYNLYQEGLLNYNIGIAAAMTLMIVLLVSLVLNLFIRYGLKDWEW